MQCSDGTSYAGGEDPPGESYLSVRRKDEGSRTVAPILRPSCLSEQVWLYFFLNGFSATD